MNHDNDSLTQYTPKKHEMYIFLFEMLGTFIFTYALGCSHQTVIGHEQNFVHCFSLLLPLALAGQVSGSYFNSTITIAAYINKRHKIIKTYLLAQFIGGILGTVWCWLLTGRMISAYEHESTLEMFKFIINEMIGSFFFSICVLALTNRFTTHAYKSWQIYVSIAVSFYLIRKMTGDTPLNPASALFYQLGSWLKTQDSQYLIYLWILVVPSTIGGFLGGLFMYKVYEPLLLFIKFKDEQFLNESHEEKDNSQITKQV